MDFEWIEKYMYVEIILLVPVFTEICKLYIKWKRYAKLSPKWKALVSALIILVIGIAFKKYFFNEDMNLVKYLLSFGAAVLFYDYAWKPITDKFKGKSALTEEKP